MSRRPKLHYCANCRSAIRAREVDRDTIGNRLLRALGRGPQHLSALAVAAYGVDAPIMRVRVSAYLKQNFRDVVVRAGEPHPKGTWRFANASPVSEAAE